MICLVYFVSRTSRSRDTGVFRRSEWKWQKEHKRKRSQILQATPHFWVACKFLFSYMEKCPGGIFWPILWNFVKPGTPRNSGFFQKRGRKRVKEWREVTFMKEWVKALDDTRILWPADLRQLFSFPRYGHLKIFWGPNQISHGNFRVS